MQHFNQFLRDEQLRDLRHVAYQSDLSVAELNRRMIDYCLKKEVLQQLIPFMSGQALLSIGER